MDINRQWKHGNPNIGYAETQQGGLYRIDRISGEQVAIQPQAGKGEKHERYNWDAPIVVSRHDPKRLYFGSYRVWKSDNRGDSWTSISPDLTKDEERLALPIMGAVQSFDNPWDVYAMSTYNTITSITESEIDPNLLYIGTDDGIIQVTEDGGANWRKILVERLPGVPSGAFVNDIKADLHDANTVYVTLDHHKFGNFKPFVYRSTDRGKSWTSISSNLPENHIVWRIVQDHVKKELMFAATEFGIYCTLNSGGKWIKLKGGVPTISFRDLAIQRRENDLIGASFGRGFFVFDDYSSLRELTEDKLKEEAVLFPTRDAWAYNPKSQVGSQGSTRYTAPNPAFGAVFTYHIGEAYTSMKKDRKKNEKKMAKNKQALAFPGWDALESEMNEEKTKLWLTIKDSNGNVIRTLKAPAKKGFNRMAWNLRYPSKRSIRLGQKENRSGRWSRNAFVAPGTYTASLSKELKGVVTPLSEPISFKVKPLRKGALEGSSPEEIVAYKEELELLTTAYSAVSNTLGEQKEKATAMALAAENSNAERGALTQDMYFLSNQLRDIDRMMNGNKAKGEVGEKDSPTIGSRIGFARRGLLTTYGPTDLHKQCLGIAREELQIVREQVEKIDAVTIPAIENVLREMGAPYIEGQPIPKGWEKNKE